MFAAKTEQQEKKDDDWFKFLRDWWGPFKMSRTNNDGGRLTIPSHIAKGIEFFWDRPYDVKPVKTEQDEDGIRQMLERGTFRKNNVMLVMQRSD